MKLNKVFQNLRVAGRALPRQLPLVMMIAVLFALLGTSQVMLLEFLGIGSLAIIFVDATALVLLCASAVRSIRGGVPWQRFGICVIVALLILVFGGEGHLLYANVDWQVRDAVLADMIRLHWPYAYSIDGRIEILRAPIGMYVVPALIGKLTNIASAEYILLFQNTLILAILLAIGSLLFHTPRSRFIALCVVTVFSGMDTIGALVIRPDIIWPLDLHIEGWAPSLQYSSIITLAFWVPQHAISGWTCGILFLIWRRGIVPLKTFLCAIPLCLLWSPLGVLGIMPFALISCILAFIWGSIKTDDIVTTIGMSILAAPSLAYLAIDAGHVGAHFVSIRPIIYFLFLLCEVVLIIVPVWLLDGHRVYGRSTFYTVAICLALFPFIMVGENVDFMMRASIPTLLILALTSADRIVVAPLVNGRRFLIIVLFIGALTPAREIYRAIIYRAAPFPACDLSASWKVSFGRFGMNTYFANRSSLPTVLTSESLLVAPPTHSACYSVPWKTPRWSFVPYPITRPEDID